jgi:hypothetical protein
MKTAGRRCIPAHKFYSDRLFFFNPALGSEPLNRFSNAQRTLPKCVQSFISSDSSGLSRAVLSSVCTSWPRPRISLRVRESKMRIWPNSSNRNNEMKGAIEKENLPINVHSFAAVKLERSQLSPPMKVILLMQLYE